LRSYLHITAFWKETGVKVNNKQMVNFREAIHYWQ
jgi:hypothetical protein